MPSRFRRLLSRGLRLRCPLCGRGKLFRTYIDLHRTCSFCGLNFERGPGYFLGGLELHWISTYVLGIAGYFPLQPYLPSDELAGLAVYMPLVMTVSLLLYRHARSLWMTIDNLVDPVEREYLELTEELEKYEKEETRVDA